MLKCVLCIRHYRNNAKFSFSLIVIKMQPRDVGIMRRYGSSWSYFRAEWMLRLPTHSRGSRLESWQPCQGMSICWTRAVVWMRVIMRRCVGRFWNVWRQQNSLVAWVRQQQHAVVSLQWTDEICGRPQSMRKLRLTGPSDDSRRCVGA